MRKSSRRWLAIALGALVFQIVPILYEEQNACVECEEGRIIAEIQRNGQTVVVRSEILGLLDKWLR